MNKLILLTLFSIMFLINAQANTCNTEIEKICVLEVWETGHYYSTCDEIKEGSHYKGMAKAMSALLNRANRLGYKLIDQTSTHGGHHNAQRIQLITLAQQSDFL